MQEVPKSLNLKTNIEICSEWNRNEMAINVYRLQPCLRGRHARRLIFYCSLCYIIWTHLTRFLSYLTPTQLPTLSQAQNNHLFASTIIDKTAENYKQPSLEEIRAQIQDETKNDHFNFTGLIGKSFFNKNLWFSDKLTKFKTSIKSRRSSSQSSSILSKSGQFTAKQYWHWTHSSHYLIWLLVAWNEQNNRVN